jgi:hypothetical protein
MLLIFHMDVAKVDSNVAYVAMVVHVCCKLLFPMFHLFFQTYVASLFIWMLHMFDTYACKCFIWILHMLCNSFKCFLGIFVSVSDVCFNYFICL